MKLLKRLIFFAFCVWAVGGCGRNELAEDLDRLHGLLLTEQYGQLDKELSDAIARHKQGVLSSNQYAQRILSFGSIDSKFKDHFDRWVSLSNTPYAHLARGVFLQEQAWKARGNQPAINTTETQFRTMREIAFRAREDLLIANEGIAHCALCSGELINNNRAIDDRTSDRDLLEKALKDDPKMWWPILAYFRGVYPNWDSYAPVQAFIREMRDRLKDEDLVAYMESKMYRDMARQALLNTGIDKLRRATEYYEKGVTARPDKMLMLELGQIYASQEHYWQAVKLLEKYQEASADIEADFLSALSDAYIGAGQLRDGMKLRERREELRKRYHYLYAG